MAETISKVDPFLESESNEMISGKKCIYIAILWKRKVAEKKPISFMVFYHTGWGGRGVSVGTG